MPNLLSTSALTFALVASPSVAQTPTAAASTRAAPAPDADDPYADQEIVVRGQKPPGSVVGDIAPEVTLGPADIRSYGVNNISDLLDELAPQTSSDRGRGSGGPVVLLNGRRISGFGEIRDLPTEAIQRVEILPEEVSLKYGYSADQRVVNIVLRRRFRALIGQAGAGLATEGGGESSNPEGNLVHIRGDQRLSVNLRYQQNAKLRESQRDLTSIAAGQPYDLAGNIAAPRGSATGEIDPALSALVGQPVTVAGVPVGVAAPTLAQFAANANDPNTTDISPYRTLKAASQQVSTNIVYAHPVFGRSTATVNGSLAYATGDALQGLPSAALTLPAGNPFSPFGDTVGLYRYLSTDPLHQRTETLTGHLGVSVNGDRGHWRWSLTGNYDYSDARTRTQTGLDTSALQAALTRLSATADPFATPAPLLGGLLVDRANATTNGGNIQAVAGGPLFHLPAGSAGTNIKIGFEDNGFAARSLRSGVAQATDLNRRNANGQINLDLPIASKRENVLAALGNLSANANIAVRQLSDFGTLRTYGYGLHWVPVTQLDLIASVTDDQGAPTQAQLGNPLVVTPQVRVFDYLAGTTVDVTQVSGGNAALRADDRRVMKLGATIKPLAKGDLTITANYLRTRMRNGIATLPEPTADIENAFPERFIRDASGALVRIDSSPVNFARERQDEVRIGFNFSVSLKSVMQRKFEEWIAARRAGKDVPPPFPLPERFQRRARQATQGRTDGAPPPPDDAPPPPPGEGGGPPPGEGGPPPGGGGGGFGGPGGAGPGGGGPGGGFGPPGGGPGGGGGGFGRRGGAAQAGGRLQVALYDTWTLRDDVLIRNGLGLIDLLHGGSVGSGGGTPEHKIELQLGYSNNGLGARLSGAYQTGTNVRAGAGSTTGDLRFSGLGTVNLRLFADLGQIPSLVGKNWARGMRVSFEASNIADSRQRVRDANGDTPLRYQPAYLDPLGRTVRVTLRKLLF